MALSATISSNCGTRLAGEEMFDTSPEPPRRISICALAVAAVPSFSGRRARAAAPALQPEATSARNFSISPELAAGVGVVGAGAVSRGAVPRGAVLTGAPLVGAESDGAGALDSTGASATGSSPAQPTSRAAAQLIAAR